MFFTVLICFFAGMGAGLGTGLCGLSAAAVIVPMLFSFLDISSYQATAVALAADVLASASSALIYARHKNINLKYGSISIIVTVCLGIKFIWKPVKEHKFAPEGKEEKKKMIQSLVCGLGIGGLCGIVLLALGIAMMVMKFML